MSGYIGTQPVPQATQTRDAFTATSNQTSFATSGYTPNFLDVFLNGVKLAAADYTASNGSDVVLATGATTGDILEVVAYTTFDTANVTGAANFTVTGSFTSQGIDDNANSTAITIDASENVGIGTSTSLSDILTVDDTNPKISIRDAGTERAFLEVDSSDNFVLNNKSTSSMIFETSDSEAMRIDSSGNLLVGNTSTGLTSDGINLHGNGTLEVRRNLSTAGSSTVAYLSRGTSEGNILQFYKDTTHVGSIGTKSGGMFIGSDDAGIFFNDHGGGNSDALFPYDVGTNTFYNGHVDIGGSVNRFRDLHLSGTANVDTKIVLENLSSDYYGTSFQINNTNADFSGSIIDIRATSGSINTTNGYYLTGYRDNGVNKTFHIKASGEVYAKAGVTFDDAGGSGTSTSNTLDDYEEGEWTPTLTFNDSSAGFVYNVYQVGRYTKIGNLVNLFYHVKLSTKGSASGYARLSNLPFVANNSNTAIEGSAHVSPYWNSLAGAPIPGGYVQRNTTKMIYIHTGPANTIGIMTDASFTNSAALYGHITYYT